jgi:putative ABC transport system permease protein
VNVPSWREHVRRVLANDDSGSEHADEIVAELEQHLEETYRRSLTEGATEEQAHSRALQELTGAPALIAELGQVHRSPLTRLIQQKRHRGLPGGIWSDVRYGCRTLGRAPWFTAMAVLTLALGIGANGAIFSVVHAVLLRELPYADPGRLVMIWESRPREGVTNNVVSPADFLDWRMRQQAFDGIAAVSADQLTLTGVGESERVGAGNVSSSFFDLLGVPPMLGRTFTVEEEQAGRNRVAILNHGFWQRRFGANPAVIGQRITLDGDAYEIIGVLPPSFRFPDEEVQLWYPIDFTDADMRERFNHFLRVFARLKDGVSIDRAQQNMDLISDQLRREVELQNQGHGAHVISLREQLVGDVRPSLLVLMAAVVFILLIACVNVASLFLARGTSRRREIAVRSVLGAGRTRILQQLVVECVVLAAVAAIVALPLAAWGVDAITSLVPMDVPRLSEVAVNPSVLAFMVGVAFATAILFGIGPAFQVSTLNLTAALKDGAATAGLSARRMRQVLVVGEIALAFVLLVGAGLMGRTLVNLLQVETGFESESVLTMPIALGPQYPNGESQTLFFQSLLGALQGHPGVVRVGFTSHVPMSGNDSRTGLGIEGRDPDDDEPVRAHWRVVTPGYFDAMRISLVRGRFPTDTEAESRAPVVVINRTAAERYWRGTDPIGARLRVLTPEWREVIGIIEDVRHWGPSSAINPEAYLPGYRTPTNLVVLGAQSSLLMTDLIRREIRRLSPELALLDVRAMSEVRGSAVASPRFLLVLLVVFASLGLVLAIGGVYSIVAYAVAQSRVDIGIRMAIGARGSDVVRLFVDEGLVLTAIGLTLGAVGAFALTRLMTGLLYGVTSTDMPTFVAVGLLMGAVALLACYVPARLAASVDPLSVLKGN